MEDKYFEESEEERIRRRKARREEMRRRKKRAIFIQRIVIPATGAVIAVAIIAIIITSVVKNKREDENKGNPDVNRTNIEESSVQSSEPFSEQFTEPFSEQAMDQISEQSTEQLSGQKAESNGVGNSGSIAGENTYEGNSQNGSGNQYQPQQKVFSARSTGTTKDLEEAVVSEYGLVIDVEKENILAARGANVRISPASMTKIITVLTAAKALGIQGENWENNNILKDKYTITLAITDYSYVNDCSNVGFSVGEQVTVEDLFYGTILPSGADAALALACYVAGSHEAFVDMMNEELANLGLDKSSHFTNCVGLYNEEHYSTVYDMAVLLKTAADIPFCREVLSKHVYTTASTPEHEEGITISNWFLRRIEDKDTHGEVLCAKTGFVVQSKNCAASLAKDKSGREYICVTAGSTSSWRCIYDHVALYQKWLPAE